MKKKEHIVKTVKPGSIAEELEIAPGDKVLAIDNTEIEDIFDYQFLTQDTYIEMLVEKPDGEQWLLEIDKESCMINEADGWRGRNVWYLGRSVRYALKEATIA